MKILLVVCLIGVCLSSAPCFADSNGEQISMKIMRNLTLIPQNNNFPTLEMTETPSDSKMGVEFMAKALGGSYNLSSDDSAPVFVRISPKGVSIRFEWKF